MNCSDLEDGYWGTPVATELTVSEGYRLYRGRCHELSTAAVAADPTLTLVRGHYFCPIWGTEEPHWWTTRPDGSVYDPSALQFPSRGAGFYRPFDGYVECAECGTRVLEEVSILTGSYGFCSDACAWRFVGL